MVKANKCKCVYVQKKLKLCARLKRSSWHDSDFVKVSFEKSYINVVNKPDSIEDDYLVILSSGPDRLELTILKITGKISLVIYNLLFPKIVNFCLLF